MGTIDHKLRLRTLYAPPSNECSIVDVPAMNFISADGKGDPNNSEEYRASVEALYSVSYAVKFMIKNRMPKSDYTVLPLEGLWWVPKMEEFSIERKSDWLWRMMIMQPEPVTAEMFNEAAERVRKKKGGVPSVALSFGLFKEGRCAQILYHGPYSEEGPTVERLHRFIADSGGERTGKHHEIYLNDPRRTAPERLRTVIRQPLKIPGG